MVHESGERSCLITFSPIASSLFGWKQRAEQILQMLEKNLPKNVSFMRAHKWKLEFIIFFVQGNISCCVCVNKVSVGWLVFWFFFPFLMPFYVSFFRVTFLNGGDQLLVVHWSNVYWRKYIFLPSQFLAGHHDYQMPSYRTQFSKKWHLASWQSPQALVLMVLEMQLGLGGCWGSIWSTLSF